jgi:uncharacterized membrane protein YedE/YeeE
MRCAANLVLGLMFGLGLVLSGMVDPNKVQNFLDLTGAWDPSLAFVMVGAIAVASVGFALVKRRPGPLLEPTFQFPTRTDMDGRLILGSAIFGIGWGLGGLCPGPALAALTLAAPGTLAFVPALLVGVMAGTMFLRMVPNRPSS